jgi:hypothetical protein
VHGLPTTASLAEIGRELSTYNSGLALSEPPRWLTTDTIRAGKSASSVTIIATGPRAQEFASLPRLCAFSRSFRIERRLRFSAHTQGANCQQFGHHTLRCPNTAACRWCTSPHSTRDHRCPTTTCSARGRACPHTVMGCANCAGPHDTHYSSCPSRPGFSAGDAMETSAST